MHELPQEVMLDCMITNGMATPVMSTAGHETESAKGKPSASWLGRCLGRICCTSCRCTGVGRHRHGAHFRARQGTRPLSHCLSLVCLDPSRF